MSFSQLPVKPEEAEDVFAYKPLFRKTKKGHYAAMGPTQEGRYLTIVFALRKNGTGDNGMGHGQSRDQVLAETEGLIAEGEDRMKVKAVKRKISDEEYYDKRGILNEIIEEDVPISLDEALKRDIVAGKRKRKLRIIFRYGVHAAGSFNHISKRIRFAPFERRKP